MKKIITAILLMLITGKSIGQTETFDITTYQPPKDWKKDTGQTVVTYSHVNTSTGSFCVLLIYSAIVSTGDEQADFNYEWTNLVTTRYKTGTSPKTETQSTGDGWKVVAGGSAVKIDSINAYLMLTVFSGFGKTVSVLATLNDQVYVPDIDALLASIKPDKEAVLSKPVTSTAQAAGNDAVSVTGIWSDYSATIGNYVSASGAFIASADASEINQYEFTAGKTFTYKYLGSLNGMMLYTESSGSYTIKGGNLTLHVKMYKSRMISRGGAGGLKEDKSKEKDEVYTFYIGPNKWEAGPFLNMHKDGNYYPWSDFPYNYYKKIR